jgi:hypothetical protein
MKVIVAVFVRFQVHKELKERNREREIEEETKERKSMERWYLFFLLFLLKSVSLQDFNFHAD